MTKTGPASQILFGYTRAYSGDSTQLTYLRSRYYSSGTGRFISADPSKLETNAYLYGKGNPINRIDPTDLFSKEIVEKNLSLTEIGGILITGQITRIEDFISS